MTDHSHPYHAPTPPAPPRPARTLLWLAFIWGLAESTVFFIVPDVLLTRLALRDLRRTTFLAALCAVAGSLIGGAALWFAAQHGHVQYLLNAFDWIPGISRELIVRTAQALHANGLPALATGALAGQPYKLYAVHAGAQDFPLLTFLAASAAARFARFALTALLVWSVSQLLARYAEAVRLRLHTYGWILFYSIYFVMMR